VAIGTQKNEIVLVRWMRQGDWEKSALFIKLELKNGGKTTSASCVILEDLGYMPFDVGSSELYDSSLKPRCYTRNRSIYALL
jgi:hypothetical protein